MRILMLAQNYPPTIGGEEQHVRNLSTGLAARGHAVSVATLWDHGLPVTEEAQGVRIHRLRGTVNRAAWLFSTGRQFAPPFPDPEIVWKLRDLVAAERPDVVHAHNWLIHSFLPLKVPSKARLVLTLHDYSLVCAKKRLMYHEAMCSGPGLKKCLACAADYYGPQKGIPTVIANSAMAIAERAMVDLFIPVSSAVARYNQLAERNLPYKIIPNFVPDDVAEPKGGCDPYLAQLPAEGFILFVGDLIPDKGLGVVLRAYADLVHAPPLVLIGRPGAETPQVLPPNVRLLADWPHDAVMEAWRRSVVALVPSVVPDSCPTVAIEAMAMGKPIIASDIGGLPDLVDEGKTGYLVPPGDAVSLRRMMERLINDDALRERMGHAGRARAERFTAHAVIPRIEQEYRAIIARTDRQ